MLNQQPTRPPFDQKQFRALIAQLTAAETALQNFVGGQGDVIIDPLSGVPVLLRTAQQALIESEAYHRRLANILHHVRDSVMATDLDGQVTYWGSGATMTYGYAEAEMVGQPVSRLYAEQAAFDAFLQHARAGTEYRAEWEARRKDGAAIWIDVRVMPLHSPEGELVGTIRVATDITERRQAQANLAHERNLLRTMVDNIPDQVFVKDRQGRLLLANPAVVAERGAGAEAELLGKTDRAFFEAAEAERSTAEEEALMAAGQASLNRDSYYVDARTGTGRWLQISKIPLREATGEVSGLVGWVRDISDAKAAEQQLRDSERRYRLLFAGNPLPMWVCDSATMAILAVNDAAVSHYGYTREAFMALTMADLQAAEAATPPEGEQGAGHVSQHRTHSGALLTVELYTQDILFSKRPARVVLARDITEQLRAEAALQAKTDEVRQMTQQLWQAARLATMGELAASIAHELNNPLATIQLRMEMFLADWDGAVEARRPLEIVARETERMSQLVANMLNFSRRRLPQITTINLGAELEKTLELIQYQLKSRHVTVRREFSPDLPPLLADPQQLRQLFLNLFTNASDAMLNGGTLTVRAQAVGEDLMVEVADTGQGIRPENLQAVMEPFYTTKEDGKGTGLGLPICRRIVQEHGGTLRLDSAGVAGQGTTVRMTLPRRPRASTADAKGQP